MRRRPEVMRVLTGHFFRRFFDNDTIQVEGDTLTTVVRALAAVAAPGLLVAFFLQNQYPQRSRWGAMEDQYFFVLFSFAVMGAVTIFEWETLFPDRIDFLVLSPLPLRPSQMLAAKAAALSGFTALFLVGANLLSGLMYVAIAKGAFFRQLLAHSCAVVLAGTFAALILLALQGGLRCLVDTPRFRVVSPVLQMGSVAVLGLLMLLYAQTGDRMELLLGGSSQMARWIPPLWFLALYDRLLYGSAAPAFVRELAGYAVVGTATAGLLVLVTYPLAWTRMRRMALEEGAHRRREPSRMVSRPVHWWVQRPAERAVFYFIGQTLRRNSRYQVFLAMYCGTGLALAAACAIEVPSGLLRPELTNRGLHAVLPLLLFWVIAGLRNGFALPLNLAARWVFRLSGGDQGECAAAAARWTFVGSFAVLGCVLGVLAFAGWTMRPLVVQAVFGVCLCVLLTDGFFFGRSIPFTCPRLPGKKNFPLMLTLYVGVLPPFLFGVVWLEMRLEQRLLGLVLLGGATAAVHVAQRLLKQGPMEVEEQMEGYEGEFQLLNLG